MVFIYLVTTGWILYISLCENSKVQEHNKDHFKAVLELRGCIDRNDSNICIGKSRIQGFGSLARHVFVSSFRGGISSTSYGSKPGMVCYSVYYES